MVIYLNTEVVALVRLTIRLPEELRERIRWLAYKERRSVNSILLEVIEKALVDVKVPEGAK